MKFIEDHFAIIAGGIFSVVSNIVTWFYSSRANSRKRKDSLEGKYTELLQKYVDLSSKYVTIIDKISKMEIENQKFKKEIQSLTIKQCTQCQHQ
ncbi:MAG: hypothetical protein HGA42_00540 [Nostocales cyanobacterium W4_Combined_metabat2_030]|nr:hypothetical protein [Nostocales cyanobacterium W4_Combined_metabat2_030]